MRPVTSACDSPCPSPRLSGEDRHVRVPVGGRPPSLTRLLPRPSRHLDFSPSPPLGSPGHGAGSNARSRGSMRRAVGGGQERRDGTIGGESHHLPMDPAHPPVRGRSEAARLRMGRQACLLAWSQRPFCRLPRLDLPCSPVGPACLRIGDGE